MTHAYYHAQSSARTFGGVPEDYLPVHNWLVLIWTNFHWSSLTGCLVEANHEVLC
jgi:hypothetical protein